MTSPITASPIFRRLSISVKSRPFRIAILGQNGVGKSGNCLKKRVQRNWLNIFIQLFAYVYCVGEMAPGVF